MRERVRSVQGRSMVSGGGHAWIIGQRAPPRQVRAARQSCGPRGYNALLEAQPLGARARRTRSFPRNRAERQEPSDVRGPSRKQPQTGDGRAGRRARLGDADDGAYAPRSRDRLGQGAAARAAGVRRREAQPRPTDRARIRRDIAACGRARGLPLLLHLPHIGQPHRQELPPHLPGAQRAARRRGARSHRRQGRSLASRRQPARRAAA